MEILKEMLNGWNPDINKKAKIGKIDQNLPPKGTRPNPQSSI